jgi:hypothetical protein
MLHVWQHKAAQHQYTSGSGHDCRPFGARREQRMVHLHASERMDLNTGGTEAGYLPLR